MPAVVAPCADRAERLVEAGDRQSLGCSGAAQRYLGSLGVRAGQGHGLAAGLAGEPGPVAAVEGGDQSGDQHQSDAGGQTHLDWGQGVLVAGLVRCGGIRMDWVLVAGRVAGRGRSWGHRVGRSSWGGRRRGGRGFVGRRRPSRGRVGWGGGLRVGRRRVVWRRGVVAEGPGDDEFLAHG